MEAKAVAKYIRISPRKERMSVSLIKGKSVTEAEAILRFSANKGAEEMVKVLRSAIANAENNLELSAESLYVTDVFVDQGPSLKRFKPRAFGRADHMVHRTSHITVVVGNERRA